ncbi:GTPase-associated system all-helical protein GASH [Brevundimonas diminuta]
MAEAGIRRLAISARKRPAVRAYIDADPPKVDFSAIEAGATAGDFARVAQGAKTSAASLRQALLSWSRRHANAITALHTHAQVQDEELQALWWLVGGVSWEFARPIDQLDPKLKSLAVATELASLTALLPGISALAALLSRAGLSDSETLAVSDVVGSSDQAWLRSTAEELQPSPVVHPLHFAVLRSLETDGGDAWVTGWAAATEFPQDVALSQAAMATQFYRERLLLRPQG